ncbi:uncharacterized protein soul5l [Menidia menidia]
MTSTWLLAVFALVALAEGSVGPSSNTSFCTESKECLEYDLVCKTDEYEVRHYSPTRWVSTDAEAYFMGVGAAMAFRRLFQYITGANDAGVQMEMTAPVLVKIPEETKMWEPAVYTLNFPLPAAYQEQPPAPTSDKLYFTEMPEMDVYVRSYGGWMLSVTSRLHAHVLTKELERVDACYNRSFHYGVGYDSPLKLLNRHNEVWYVAEGQPVCTDPREPTPAHTPQPTPSSLPADPPSGPLAQMLSDGPSPALSNASTDASSNSSSQPPSDQASDPASVQPSTAPAGLPSELPADATSGRPSPSPSAVSSQDLAAGSSSPAPISPSVQPQPATGQGNATSVDAGAEPTTAAQPDSAQPDSAQPDSGH